MRNFEDLSSLTVTEAMHLLRDGSLSAEKYTESLLDRAEIHRNLNAFITLDRVQALTRLAMPTASAPPAPIWALCTAYPSR